jgi:hypothetical protein
MSRVRFALISAVLLHTAVSGACRDREGRAPAPSPAVDSAFTVAGRRVPPPLLNRYVAEHEGFTSRGGEMRCAYVPLGQEGDRLFINTLCLELVRDGDTLASGSGRGGPVALRVAPAGDSVRVVEHEVPADGGEHAASVRRIFPAAVVDRIFAPTAVHNARADTLETHLRAAAAARLGVRP